MSWSAARTAIIDHLRANWTASPVTVHGESFERPKDSAGGPAPFVLLRILSGPGGNYSGYGSFGKDRKARVEQWGRIFVDVFMPINCGTDLAYDQADAIGELFNGVKLDPAVQCFAPAGDPGGQGDEEGNYWRAGVTIQFRHDYR